MVRDPHWRAAGMPLVTSEQLPAVMTETLSADLEGRVPLELVPDIVRAVLDESRRAAQDRGIEPTVFEARRRLERFIRARSFV